MSFCHHYDVKHHGSQWISIPDLWSENMPYPETSIAHNTWINRSLIDLKPLKYSKPFPKRQLLDCSKLKECADDNLKFDGNGRMVSKWVENTV